MTTPHPHDTASPKTLAFTIVELLVVIVVIAILAAVTVVAYNGIQNRAYDSVVQSDLTTSAKKIEQFRIQEGVATYPAHANQLTPVGIHASSDAYSIEPATTRNFIYCTTENNEEFFILGKSRSGNAYVASTRNLSSRPYAGTWNSSTGALGICQDVTGQSSPIFTAGYYIGNPHSNNWNTWTGASIP